jgi:VanZ family protein
MKYWMPAVMWAVLIFISSSIQEPAPGVEFPFVDKLLHLLVYTLLGYLVVRALLNYRYNLARTQLLVMAVLLGTFYGISDEIHQSFVPGRIACAADAFFDLVGSALGVYIYDRRHKE